MQVRQYQPGDYETVKALYEQGELFGGQFDPARDSKEVLDAKSAADPDAILIAEETGVLLGTVSLIEDGRVAWLFRFAVTKERPDVGKALYERAVETLKDRGHTQVLVYAPLESEALKARYIGLGMHQGNEYRAFWKEI